MRQRLLADRRIWFMAAFGFISGLPLSLSGFTLRQWLTEAHVSLGAIGLTANIGLAYTLKFLWAPLLDHVRPPRLLARFGQRRGWLLAVEPVLALACLILALSDAAATPWVTIAAAALIALSSATQDIVIDAWRIETFPQAMQGAAMAVYVWGYRVAMLVAGSGVIAGVDLLGWHGALMAVTVLAALAIPVTLAAPEPAVLRTLGAATGRVAARVRSAVVEPFRDFLTRPGAGAILLYVALFKVGEAMAGVMLPSLYRSLGFTRTAVAAAGPYSLGATIAGIALGGTLVARLGLGRALISTGLIQTVAMGMYVWLAVSPGDHLLLYGTVVTEAFLQGLADAAFLTYLSGLCSLAHTATHYALLSSLAALASNTVGGLSGVLAAAVGWPRFYTVTMFAALPGIAVMLFIIRRYELPDDGRYAATSAGRAAKPTESHASSTSETLITSRQATL
ncbi:MAG: MFS transporter [Acidisphaera sp.]|nr:MFS transporter [Acidisphaera sp.]